jgi:hypothetical protein
VLVDRGGSRAVYNGGTSRKYPFSDKDKKQKVSSTCNVNRGSHAASFYYVKPSISKDSMTSVPTYNSFS